jgi:ribosomal protein L29
VIELTMVEKKVHEKIRARTEDEVKGDVVKLKEELKDLRNNKAANANSTKAARIKVHLLYYSGYPKVHRSPSFHH